MILCFSTCLFGQSKEAAKKEIWSLLKKNNPDAHGFMHQLYNFPDKLSIGNMTITSSNHDFMVWVDGYDQESILSSISTVVHESCHMYQSKKPLILCAEKDLPYSFENKYTVYFIDQNQEYLVQETPTFPSRKIAAHIPKNLRSFRYNTYINTGQRALGTQQSGVYGLMDEWAAYFNGFKTTVLNFNEYQRLGQLDGFKSFLGDAGSIRIAYPEFKYYILTYLTYAQQNDPKIYHAIVANEDFRKAYWSIDKAYSAIIQAYEKTLDKIKVAVESQGMSYSFGDDFVMLGNSGIGSYNKEYKNFMTATQSEELRKVIGDLSR